MSSSEYWGLLRWGTPTDPQKNSYPSLDHPPHHRARDDYPSVSLAMLCSSISSLSGSRLARRGMGYTIRRGDELEDQMEQVRGAQVGGSGGSAGGMEGGVRSGGVVPTGGSED